MFACFAAFLVGMLVLVVAWSSFFLCVYAIVCLAVCVCIFRYWTIGFASNRRLYPISFVSSGDVYFARIRNMRI